MPVLAGDLQVGNMLGEQLSDVLDVEIPTEFWIFVPEGVVAMRARCDDAVKLEFD